MKRSTYYLRLVTPAFLGNAKQQGEWRTPPVKALFRQWWRVLLFSQSLNKDKPLSIHSLREREAATFGHAWLEDDNHRKRFFRSPLRLFLDGWNTGTLSELRQERRVDHPEVGRNVGALLYLGYGPLTYEKAKGSTVLKWPPALDAGSTARLILEWPEREPDRVGNFVSWLVIMLHWFGAMGGRSRNGWGSLHVFQENGEPVSHFRNLQAMKPLFVPLKVALQHYDWPCGIGKDANGPLVWVTKEQHSSWQEAMEEVARIKIAFRTAFPFLQNEDARDPRVDERHVLAYPVTNHGVLEWSETAKGKPILDDRGRLKQRERLANQLRFKVHRVQGKDGKDRFVAIAFHLPHRLPDALWAELSDTQRDWVRENELEVWSNVHAVLDEKMARLA
jgi:CRISPR-associated protein Cmr1